MKWSQAASLTCRLSSPREISFTTLRFLPAASERGHVGKRVLDGGPYRRTPARLIASVRTANLRERGWSLASPQMWTLTDMQSSPVTLTEWRYTLNRPRAGIHSSCMFSPSVPAEFFFLQMPIYKVSLKPHVAPYHVSLTMCAFKSPCIRQVECFSSIRSETGGGQRWNSGPPPRGAPHHEPQSGW